MEPVSILFSSFLTGMTSGLHNHIIDVVGTEIQSQVIEYHNQKIDFQYQLWRINDKSVCAREKDNNLSNHSTCTLEAKQLFGDTCSYLQSHPQQHWKFTKTKNMYCTAAANFKPTVAQISTPTEAEAELWDLKQRCSLLTLEARNTGSKKVQQEKEKACTEYQQLR